MAPPTTKFCAYHPHPRVQLTCSDATRAKQSFASECDINNIMARYQKTGLVTHVAAHQGNYTDLPAYDDFHASMNAVTAANSSFASLPSSVRSRFHNDPGEFLDFVQDKANADEMVSMGLSIPSQEEPIPAPMEPEPAPSAEADGA